MAAIIAQLARIAIMALATAAPLTAVQEFFDGTVKKLVDAIRSEQGLTLDEAKDVLVNILVDLALNAAIIGTVLKTKIALKTADYLGLTTRGLTKRKLTPKAEAAVKRMAGPWEKFKKYSLVSKLLTLGVFGTGLTWIGIGFANVVEPGVYQPAQANNVWQSIIGVRPFPEPDVLESPPPFGKAEFTDYALSLEFSGVTGINDPFKAQSLPYSRDNLAGLIFTLYGTNIAKGVKLTAKPMIAEVAKYLVIPGRPTSTAAPIALTSTAQPSVPNTRVFVGAIGAGRLTSAADFTARPDDLIENMDELEKALRNNLTSFLAASLGRFVYETKVVSSVTTKDGFTQRGTAQQVISGYTATGTPRYKTVVNKFAVADVYFITESGTRSKAARIVLGPTDAIKFQPTGEALNNLDLGVKRDIVTTSTSEVSEVKQGTNTTVLPKPDAAPYATKRVTTISDTAAGRLFRAGASNGTPPPDQLYADTGTRIYLIPNLQAVGAGIWESVEEYLKAFNQGTHYDVVRTRLKERYGIDFDKLPARNPADLERDAIQAGYETQPVFDLGRGNVQNPIYIAHSVSELLALAEGADTTRPVGVGPVCTAESLKAFFAARGEPLPSVETRSVLYEQYGLGSKGFYTGTTDQNIKLLAALKASAGCPIEGS